MNDGATTEVIESQPIANANDSRFREKNASRQAGIDRAGPRSRNGLRTFTRSETRPSTTAAMPAASENRANRRPKANESLVRRNEPSGVATESNPSTPPCPANARAVREPILRRSMTYEKDSSRRTSRRARIRLPTRIRPPREKRNGKPTVSARYPPRTGATTATVMKGMATSPGSARYRKRCAMRNGGGAGGAETIQAAPTDAPVQRDFVSSFACQSKRRVLAVGGARVQRGQTCRSLVNPAMVSPVNRQRRAARRDSSRSRIGATPSALSRAEDAAMPTRMENAFGGSEANSASSVQSSPIARMKSHDSRESFVAKWLPLFTPARRISTTLFPGRT